MSTHSKFMAALLPLLLGARFAVAADVPPATVGDLESTRQAFVAAMQRVRLHLPETPDSPRSKAMPSMIIWLRQDCAGIWYRDPARTWTRRSTRFCKPIRANRSRTACA